MTQTQPDTFRTEFHTESRTFTWATPGNAVLMRVPKLPVPAIMKGSAFIAARMRAAASACLFDRREGSAMLAIACARRLSGVSCCRRLRSGLTLLLSAAKT